MYSSSVPAAEVGGKFKYFTVSRQMVLFAIERRKAWRMLQSKAGVENKDYPAQKALLKKVEKGELTRDELLNRGWELLNEELEAVKAEVGSDGDETADEKTDEKAKAKKANSQKGIIPPCPPSCATKAASPPPERDG